MRSGLTPTAYIDVDGLITSEHETLLSAYAAKLPME